MSLLSPFTFKRPPIGQVYDKHARYTLETDADIKLALDELLVTETKTEHCVYLRIDPESVFQVDVFTDIVGRIQSRANKHTTRLRLEPLRRKYTLEEINYRFLHILVSDKQNMRANLARGNQLQGCYRVAALGGMSEAVSIDLESLGNITHFYRCR